MATERFTLRNGGLVTIGEEKYPGKIEKIDGIIDFKTWRDTEISGQFLRVTSPQNDCAVTLQFWRRGDGVSGVKVTESTLSGPVSREYIDRLLAELPFSCEGARARIRTVIDVESYLKNAPQGLRLK